MNSANIQFMEALVAGNPTKARNIIANEMDKGASVEEVCKNLVGTSMRAIEYMDKTNQFNDKERESIHRTALGAMEDIAPENANDRNDSVCEAVVGVQKGSIWGKAIASLVRARGLRADLVIIDESKKKSFSALLKKTRPSVVIIVVDKESQIPLSEDIFLEVGPALGKRTRGKGASGTQWILLGKGLNGAVRQAKAQGWDFVAVDPLRGIRHLPKRQEPIVTDGDILHAQKLVAKRIQDKRIALGLTQGGLGEILLVTKSYVSHVESGSVNLSLGQLLKFCGGLKMSVSELVEGMGGGSLAPPPIPSRQHPARALP